MRPDAELRAHEALAREAGFRPDPNPPRLVRRGHNTHRWSTPSDSAPTSIRSGFSHTNARISRTCVPGRNEKPRDNAGFGQSLRCEPFPGPSAAGYPSSCSTCCDCWLARARTEVPALARICARVNLLVSTAKSASLICDSLAVRFSNCP